MRDLLSPEHRETLVALIGMAHTIELRLKDMEAQLEFVTVSQQAIEMTRLKANTLLVALSNHLID
jgi:hypothetical protein